jgi:hypothetical protein
MAVEHGLKIQQKILALLDCSYGSHRDNPSASLLLYVISLGGRIAIALNLHSVNWNSTDSVVERAEGEWPWGTFSWASK